MDVLWFLNRQLQKTKFSDLNQRNTSVVARQQKFFLCPNESNPSFLPPIAIGITIYDLPPIAIGITIYPFTPVNDNTMHYCTIWIN